MPQRTEVLLIYLAGLAQGLALVTFPAAASSIFTSPHSYDLSVSRYELMFIPQVILAISPEQDANLQGKSGDFRLDKPITVEL